MNLLKTGIEDLSTRRATKPDDKFDRVRWLPSTVAPGVPILVDAITALVECTGAEVIERRNHVPVIGAVVDVRVGGGPPPLCYRRTYAAWPAEQPAPPVL